MLAIFVTRSSALSMQAKLGLPRGNQIVGWFVLGMLLGHDLFTATDPASTVVFHASFA